MGSGRACSQVKSLVMELDKSEIKVVPIYIYIIILLKLKMGDVSF